MHHTAFVVNLAALVSSKVQIGFGVLFALDAMVPGNGLGGKGFKRDLQLAAATAYSIDIAAVILILFCRNLDSSFTNIK